MYTHHCFVVVYREQLLLKGQLITADSPEVRSWKNGRDLFANLQYIGGVDISFVKGACAMLVILNYPELKVRVITIVYYTIRLVYTDLYPLL